MIYFGYDTYGDGIRMNKNKLYLENEKKVEFELQTKELVQDIVQSLVAARKQRGITQQNIADITGMKTSNVTRIESCRNTPTLEVLIRYANALGKKVNFELDDIPEVELK